METKKETRLQLNKSGRRSAELLIYDTIGSGSLFEEGLAAKDVVMRLGDEMKDVNDINVRINSPGGNARDAIAIFRALTKHPAQVMVSIEGAAISAASVVAMAGDFIVMHEAALMMIHDPHMQFGPGEVITQDRLAKASEMLERTKTAVMRAYLRQVDMSEDELSALLTAETWMTAEEAMDRGFIHDIDTGVAIAAEFDPAQIKCPKEYQDRLDALFTREAAMSLQEEERAMREQKEQVLSDVEKKLDELRDESEDEEPDEEKEKEETMSEESTSTHPAEAVATVQELQEALLNAPPEFVLAQATEGVTLQAAKDAWMAELSKKVKEMGDTATLPQSVDLGATTAAGTVYENAKEMWDAKVRDLVEAKGLTRADASLAVHRNYPGLKDQMVNELNTHRGRPLFAEPQLK